ncbi:MAG: hypothetical protein LBD58_08105 [Treponema sp.]|jgi:hypothetical protein|nr:hypothetical protein [Treponema sp.]
MQKYSLTGLFQNPTGCGKSMGKRGLKAAFPLAYKVAFSKFDMLKKPLAAFFFISGVTVIIFFASCAGSVSRKAGVVVNYIGVYDLSSPAMQQCLLIIPRQITVLTIDGDTVQWNWNNVETHVRIPSGSHVLSVKRNKKTVDIMFNFMPNAFYTFNIKKGVVTIIEAAETQ